MIPDIIRKKVNIIYYELFDAQYNPVIGIVSRGISGELFSVMMWRPMMNNMRNFHHYLQYGDLFDL